MQEISRVLLKATFLASCITLMGSSTTVVFDNLAYVYDDSIILKTWHYLYADISGATQLYQYVCSKATSSYSGVL